MTYRIFAVASLVTGIIYFIFNVTYLKKHSQLEGNDIKKKKPKKIDEQDSPEKHTNDISLDEKPQNERINNKNNTMENDNKGFLKEESQSNKKTDELNLTQIETIRNARNIDETDQNPIRKHEDKLATKSNTIQTKIEESDTQESCFINPNFEIDLNQSKITVENDPSTSQNDKHID